MNYYRRYVGDFQRDTGHLSLIEIGAYDRLLDHLYATETPLPAEMNVLCRICRAVTSDEQAAVESVVAQFFPLNGGGKRHNKRAQKEISVSQTARDNGKGGGRPKTGTITGSVTDHETGEITGTQTEKGGGLVHPPTTNHHPPASTHQPSTTIHQPGSKAKARAKKPAPPVSLPPWTKDRPEILDAWQAFIDMRKAKRKPMTARAVELTWKDLSNWNVDGHDVTAILLRSVQHGWTGVHLPDAAQVARGTNSIATANERAAQTWLESSQPATQEWDAESAGSLT